jgi:hypothetical protein
MKLQVAKKKIVLKDVNRAKRIELTRQCAMDASKFGKSWMMIAA